MRTNNSDVEQQQQQQQQSPGRQRRGGLERSLRGESMNFSAYLNAQRKLSSQRYIQTRASVRNLRVPSFISEKGDEDQSIGSKNNYAATSTRQLHRLTTSEWDDIFDDLGDIDENGQFHDAHAHIKPFYSPPVQRQRWGEDQVLPHVNWGESVDYFLLNRLQSLLCSQQCC